MEASMIKPAGGEWKCGRKGRKN